MNIISIAQFIWAAAAVGIVTFVLLHSPKGDGIGGIGGQAQLFTSAKSAELTLNRITWALFAVFIGLTVVLSANWIPGSQVPAAAPSTDITAAAPQAPVIPQTIPSEAPALPTTPQPSSQP
jgi:preprotein translocase subunit SecG